MELENVTLEDIRQFYDSLVDEKRFVLYPWDFFVLRAEYLVGFWIGGELAGFACLVPANVIFHNDLVVVKQKFQRRGIWTQLAKHLERYARRKGYSFYCAWVRKINEPSWKAHIKLGFKSVCEVGDSYLMVYYLNRKGELIAKILPAFIKAGYWLKYSALRRARP